MKVLHLPHNIGGMAAGLAAGEKVLGLDSKVLLATRSSRSYPCDIALGWEKKSLPAIFLNSVAAFLKYRNKFDVYHFNYGATLIDFRGAGIYHWDLPFYPKGKKLVFTYNGCDARQRRTSAMRYEITPCREKNCYAGICENEKNDVIKKRSIDIVSKYADHIFAVNPDLMNFLPEGQTSFLPYALGQWYSIEYCRQEPGKEIRIVHAPTEPVVKGSSYILSATEKLKKKYKIEVTVVQNKSNEEALLVYRKADLIIDQVLVGWYGGFAVEAMKMGKPVACYIREEDLKFVPPDMARDLKRAIININPFNIEETLSPYLENTRLLKEKSEAGIEYVNKWHDPVYVAGITKAVYEKN